MQNIYTVYSSAMRKSAALYRESAMLKQAAWYNPLSWGKGGDAERNAERSLVQVPNNTPQLRAANQGSALSQMQQARDVGQDYEDSIGNHVAQGLGNVADAMYNAGDAVANAGKGAWGWIKGKANAAKDAVVGAGRRAYDAAADAGDAIINGARAAGRGVANAYDGATESMANGMNNAYQAGKAGVNAAVNGVKGAYGAVRDLQNQAGDALGGAMAETRRRSNNEITGINREQQAFQQAAPEGLATLPGNTVGAAKRLGSRVRSGLNPMNWF